MPLLMKLGGMGKSGQGFGRGGQIRAASAGSRGGAGRTNRPCKAADLNPERRNLERRIRARQPGARRKRSASPEPEPGRTPEQSRDPGTGPPAGPGMSGKPLRRTDPQGKPRPMAEHKSMPLSGSWPARAWPAAWPYPRRYGPSIPASAARKTNGRTRRSLLRGLRPAQRASSKLAQMLSQEEEMLPEEFRRSFPNPVTSPRP